ncbi:receptor-like protein EIX2 [Corylus avellana]|uniref:receptor-like protein EIX2 n=1 Tax=Corylus avellana TaxID=13451 RepID=UPI00286CFA46|nr:receptor-like protein EIX2 [Corylus avellana]XP_059461243.1 receptor-like protein EIX2 [Corylus avellana]
MRCIEEERQALFKFKQGLEDNFSMLSSWGSDEEDCCKWEAIKCSNQTGHVEALDLSGKYLSGEIRSSLLGLQHLTYLDLSYNHFSILPKLIGSLTKLQYLNLSDNNFFGTIPPQFGNLTNLISLDISGYVMLSVDHGPTKVLFLTEDYNLDWLFHLSSLRHLDMSGVNLSKVVNWPDKVNMLPSLLQDLRLSHCQLSMPVPPTLINPNCSSPLSFLDLSANQFNSSIFPWLFKYYNRLVHLDLHFTKIEGLIPKALGKMVALVHLDLSYNKLEGVIPNLSKLSLLRELHLSNNQLNGSLDNVLGKLSKLQVLDLSLNSLKGVITETHLSNLSNLNQLDLSYNYDLSLKFSPDWIPPFHLDYIGLRSCKLGPTFPQWIQTQKNFSSLDISDARISDTIPNWFWDLSFNIKYLNISANQITGTIPFEWFSTRFQSSYAIDLSDNRFSCPLPQLNSNSWVLNLSNNLFQGTVTFICESDGSLEFLDLSNNLLSGELPKCWPKVGPAFLNLANNNLSGRIPESLGKNCLNYSHFASLHFQNNSFIGELPVSLMNCSSLSVIDFGENKLSGRIPTWIGTSLPQLMILRLPSNEFVGSIPLQLCQLTSLQILDISHNSISGTIPRCINNFAGMTQKQNLKISRLDFGTTTAEGSMRIYWQYNEKAWVNTKGMPLEYKKILDSVKVIDLSSNRLEGEIPREVTSLLELIGLNLSRNLLTGVIPQNIGDLKSLESLDLSSNHLSYVIPQSLATLSFLSYLNLSNNNLSGRVPTGTQLQSFTASSYAGNLDLCGLPLNRCLEDNMAQGPQIGSTHEDGNIEEHENSHEHLWFYMSIAIGFIVGFWGVCGSLILKITWRHAYFQFLDRMGDRLFVTIVVNMAKLLRNFKTQCYQENV